MERPAGVAETSVPEEGADFVAGNFQCQAQLSGNRTIVMTGYVYHKDDAAKISARVDLVQDELDRQILRCDIQNKELQRKAMMEGVVQVRDQLADFQARQEGAGTGLSKDEPRRQKLSSQEKLALQNGDAQVKKMLENVASLDKAILEGKRKLGTAA
jgi:F0F1-type ATP synthase epsilon subunit